MKLALLFAVFVLSSATDGRLRALKAEAEAEEAHSWSMEGGGSITAGSPDFFRAQEPHYLSHANIDDDLTPGLSGGYTTTRSYTNTGSRNTGYTTTGSRNTGYLTSYTNTGSRNTGSGYTGYTNTGSRNTGYTNKGLWDRSCPFDPQDCDWCFSSCPGGSRSWDSGKHCTCNGRQVIASHAQPTVEVASHDEVTNGDDHHSVRASSSSSHTAAVALSVVGIGMVGGVALLVSRKRNKGKIHLEEPLTCNTNDAYVSI